MNKILTTLLVMVSAVVTAQENKILTLENCWRLAEENYPLVKKRGLISKSSDYNLSNISRGYLPQFGIYGQATYQSEVTSVPVSIPGIDAPKASKDQYKLYGELNQVLYDGGQIHQQKQTEKARKSVESQKLEVELYGLKERVSNLYFGILIVNDQLLQNELLKSDIQIGIKTVEAQITNGTALRSNADILKAELLRATQQTITLKNNKSAYLEMLGLFTGQELNENTPLETPQTPIFQNEINRPELALYQYQNESLELQKKTISTSNLPRLNLFVQGGVGNPALNIFNDGLDSYYMGGMKLNWNLTGFYTSKKQKEIINLNKLDTEAQKETFLFNTNFTLKQQNAEIAKLNQYVTTDNEIIKLRGNVKKAAFAQLQNGVITANDFLKEVNAENEAVQNKIMHQTELLLAQYNEKITRGL